MTPALTSFDQESVWHHIRVQSTLHAPARRRRIASIILFAALVIPFLAGCLRVQVSMGVSSNDRVSGQIVAAAVPQHDGDKGPQLKAPSTLGSRVRIQPYNQDGYIGTQAYFEDLSFADVAQLNQLSAQAEGIFDLQFQRKGDLVTLNGKVDLKKVRGSSDVQFTVAFPAHVATTNGTREGDTIVTWKLPPGESSTLRADVRYADPNTRGFAGWAGIVVGVTLGVAVIIGGLAYVNRNPMLRPELAKPIKFPKLPTR